MNRTRPLFLVCFLLLTGLSAFNSYADEVTIEYLGGIYTGEVSKGVPDGQGTTTFVSGQFKGDMHVGEYKDGLANGQGAYTFADGRKYVGETKDDKRHGQGTITTLDGEKYVGEWKDDNPWNGTHYDKDGNVTATFSDGVRKEN